MEYKLAKLNDREGILSKQWYVEYQFKNPETGQWERFRKVISNKLKTATARKDVASALIKKTNNWLKEGGNPFLNEIPKIQTVVQALSYVLEYKKAVCRKRSYYTYKNVITIFSKFLKHKKRENLRLEEMNVRIAQEFMDWVVMVHKVSNRTHNYYLMDMVTFFNDLVKRHYTELNPFKGLNKLETEETSIVAFTKAELYTLKTVLPKEDPQLWLCAGLIYYCALRPAEIMRLRIKDLLLDEGKITISGGQSKNKKSALIYIPNNDFLNDLKEAGFHLYPMDFHVFSKNLKPGIREAAPTRIAGRWRSWASKNNISRNIYDLKHTAAGMAVTHGVNLRDIQLHYRHSALSITEQYLNRCGRLPGISLNKYPSM